MSAGCRICFLLVWLILTFTCALLLFTKGFLLKRVVIDQGSYCQPNHWLMNNLWHGIQTNIRLQEESVDDSIGCNYMTFPKFSKSVFVIIDGLRYDFLQYHHKINSSMALPFQNKMKKLKKILGDHPTKAKLFKFEADPPTTTMQRIKGMMTGSLPTFVDAGTNFASAAITEDNILDHIVRRGRNVSFMGCSTWTELFPTQFHRKLPFSALNVKDLDTIDYGIMKHIVSEIKRDDWKLLIAHFLGVDHCGHRYGTHHHEMTRKLTEMDNVISDLVSTIDDDTILFVMGDHGMTMSGDHGGDSPDEVMAGLFAYSKKSLFVPPEYGEDLPRVSQIDLVPTLSLMLDIPIPFSNLGTVIPHFFTAINQTFLYDFPQEDTVEERDSNAPTLKQLYGKLFENVNLVYASYLNCKQILNYIGEYQKSASDLPSDKIEAVRASFDFLEKNYEDNLGELVLIDWSNLTTTLSMLSDIEEKILEFDYLQLSFQNVLQNIKTICRSIWAKFDIVSMSLGLSLMLFISLLVSITSVIFMNKSIIEPGQLSWLLYIVGLFFCFTGLIYLAIPFEETEMASFVVFAAASFSLSLWLFSCGVPTLFMSGNMTFYFSRCFSWHNLFYIACLILHLGSLFSNSFIIHEDTSMLFLCESFILFNFLCQFVSAINEYKMVNTSKSIRPINFAFLHTKILQLITDPQMLQTYLFTALLMICMRLTRFFWFCREMQLQCDISPYSLPLVALLSEFTEGYAHERLFVAFISIIMMTLITYFYLKKRGNLVGNTSSLLMRFTCAACILSIMLHWSLQLILTHGISKELFDVNYFQQVTLPRVVYILSLIYIIYLVCKPLCIMVIFRDKGNKLKQDIDSGNVQRIYQAMTDIMNESSSNDESNAPLVYGLKTVYSSAFIILLLILTLVASMVLSDGMAAPVNIIWICAYFLCRIFSLGGNYSFFTNRDLIVPIIVWNSVSSLGFFGTGHQTSISSIRFHAAYVGFRGSLPEIVPQVIVILFNTYSSQIIFSLALPLLLIFQRLSFSPTCTEKNENEFALMENPDASRINLFKMLITYLGIVMFKVSFTAASASLHRRHLMVWKIFAPRFLFEVVGFLVTAPVLLIGFAYFLRIDNKLKRWTEELSVKMS